MTVCPGGKKKGKRIMREGNERQQTRKKDSASRKRGQRQRKRE
jgi:hypothetical protein